MHVKKRPKWEGEEPARMLLKSLRPHLMVHGQRVAVGIVVEFWVYVLERAHSIFCKAECRV